MNISWLLLKQEASKDKHFFRCDLSSNSNFKLFGVDADILNVKTLDIISKIL